TTGPGDNFQAQNGAVQLQGTALSGNIILHNTALTLPANGTATGAVVLQQGNTAAGVVPAGLTLWVQGEYYNGDANLTLAGDLTNQGTIYLQDPDSGYASKLHGGAYTLTNAPNGVI